MTASHSLPFCVGSTTERADRDRLNLDSGYHEALLYEIPVQPVLLAKSLAFQRHPSLMLQSRHDLIPTGSVQISIVH